MTSGVVESREQTTSNQIWALSGKIQIHWVPENQKITAAVSQAYIYKTLRVVTVY